MADVSHIPIYLLERHLADATDAAQQERIASHLPGCAQCQTRLADMQKERRAFLERNPPDLRARQLLQSRRKARRRPSLLWLPSLAALATAAVVVVTWVDLSPNDRRQAVLSKGSKTVSLRVQRADGARLEAARSGEAFAPGDRLQLHVHAPEGFDHIAVYSMNHRGSANHLFDASAQDAAKGLPSLVLDDATEPERLYVLLSVTAVPDKEVLEALQRAFGRAQNDIVSLETVIVPGHPSTVVESILVRKRAPSRREGDLRPTEPIGGATRPTHGVDP